MLVVAGSSIPSLIGRFAELLGPCLLKKPLLLLFTPVLIDVPPCFD